MKKKILSMFLAGITMFSLFGCEKVSGFELGHFDGSDTSAGWDTDLLYKNTSEFLGGDSGVMWVSEEDDPVYGGYFYQYMSECGHVHNNNVPSNNNGDTAVDKNDAAYTSHIAVSRSKDLYDWELCGVVDNGLGLKLGMNAFMNKGIWAPETIRDPKTGKYFMYFGGQGSTTYVDRMREKYGDEPKAGTFSTLWTSGVAVSDTPVGPFEIVTSENFYNGEPNLNGEYLYEDWPTFDFARWFGFENGFQGYNTDYSPFFDVNGDFYIVFNSSGTTHKDEPNESGSGIGCWGVKMKDMVTPDWSTLTWLMGTGETRKTIKGDDGPRDPNKPWRDGTIIAPVRVEYKGNATNNVAFEPYDDRGLVKDEKYAYKVNPDFINDPTCPRSEFSSYYQWEEWQDGTPNTEFIEIGGMQIKNPDYNCHPDPGNQSQGFSGIREGVQLINYPNKNGEQVYYLTFTYTGVQGALYNVHYATSNSPLGNVNGKEFTIPKNTEFSMTLGVDVNNDYMSNLGHHDFVDVDGEWWIVHWEWSVPFAGFTSGTDIGRIYALSPMAWIDDPERTNGEYYVPVANGPTQHLQAKPFVATGYKNIAGDAKIDVTNAVVLDEDGKAKKSDETIKYLTDGYTVTKYMYRDWALHVEDETTITLTFDDPRIVRGILVYNSYEYNYAFSKIDSIQFELAETPSWYDGKGTSCYIRDLGFPVESAMKDQETIYSGIASVATFNEIKVKEIKITIKDHLGKSDILNIAEVMVYGK